MKEDIYYTKHRDALRFITHRLHLFCVSTNCPLCLVLMTDKSEVTW